MRSNARTLPNNTLDSSLSAGAGGELVTDDVPSPGGTPPAGGPNPGCAAVIGPGPKLRPFSRISWPGLSVATAVGSALDHSTAPLSWSTTASTMGRSVALASASARTVISVPQTIRAPIGSAIGPERSGLGWESLTFKLYAHTRITARPSRVAPSSPSRSALGRGGRRFRRCGGRASGRRCAPARSRRS